MAAASTAFVDTGVSWIPTTQRVYQSIPTVNSACTHRKVTGSRANTSSRVVSINRYSPGRVGRSFPYGPSGRAAMSRLRLVLNRNVGCPRSSSSSIRNAVARDGSFTTPAPNRATTRACARTSPIVRDGRD